MEIRSLLHGSALVIDDEIGKEEANISKLISQIGEMNLPMIFQKKIPNDEYIYNISEVAFILLDWKLADELADTSTDVPVSINSDYMPEALAQTNINFINTVRSRYFTPIFIFTDEPVDDIKEILIREELYSEEKPNIIFIKNKNELTAKGAIEKELKEWIKKMPSVYVLKKWEKNLKEAKVSFFNEIFERSPCWPSILWKTFEDDDLSPSYQLGSFINRCLNNRIKPCEFSKKNVNVNLPVSQDEIKKILEAERYISESPILDDSPLTGDIFKKDGKYYINIRPHCDLIPRNGEREIKLYLLKGKELKNKNISIKNAKLISDEGNIVCNGGEKNILKKQVNPTRIREINYAMKRMNSKTQLINGQLIEKKDQVIIPFIDNGKIICFELKTLSIEKWSEYKEDRIGRLLQPFIGHVQKRFSQNLIKEGLPRIPDDVF